MRTALYVLAGLIAAPIVLVVGAVGWLVGMLLWVIMAPAEALEERERGGAHRD